jgi:hypothetical protein
MANDFSSDPNCVALWKFDNNASDAKGSNDLTPVNSPAYDSGDKKEGSYCIDLEHSSAQYAYITDANLDAGFPGKNGTSEPSFSICLWAKAESFASFSALVNKQKSGAASYTIFLNTSGALYFLIGYNGGANTTNIIFDTALSTGIWYHIAVVYDASSNEMKIRVWDDNAGALLDSNKEGTAGGDMSPGDANLEIGRWNENNSYTFDGKIDEVVFFDKVLSDEDIDAIRAGSYGGGATAKESADSGSGVEAVESLQTPSAKTSSDIGSGAEGTPTQSAILAGSESGAAIEDLISRLLASDESGGGIEASSVNTEGQFKDLAASEGGEGLDRLIARMATPTKGGGRKLWI